MTAAEVWIGTSWKMNKTLAGARAFAHTLVQELALVRGLAGTDSAGDPRLRPFVIPPFTVVRDVATILADTPVMVGAQNMHWEDAGAWTGEISPVMLKDCGVDIVEIGHSERRTHFGETDATVGLKVAAAVRHGLIPLICIGETLAEREAGQAAAVLEARTRGALARLTDDQKAAPILLAYEPVWAIGEGGVPATAAYADARQADIVAVAASLLGRRLPCLYGGSVNPDNGADLIRCRHIDGLFIGRAAWEVEGYLNILATCAAAI